MIQNNYRDEKEETNEVIIADEFEEDYIDTIWNKMGKFDEVIISCTNTHKNYAERIIRSFFCLGWLPNDKMKIEWNTDVKEVSNKKGQRTTSEINSITLFKRENLKKFIYNELDINDSDLPKIIIADKPEKIYFKRILDISKKSNVFVISCINTYVPNAEKIIIKCFNAGFHLEGKMLQWNKCINEIENKRKEKVNREVNKIKLIKDDELFKYVQ